MKAVCVDTGYLLALELTNDQHHQAATRHWQGIVTWTYFQRHQDKDYSLTDCISFLVMQRLGIGTAFAFDQHFVQAAFTKEP